MADDNVVDLPCITTLDITPDRVLEKAIGEMDYVLVMGWDKDGELYFASSESDDAEALWVMELAKKELLDI